MATFPVLEPDTIYLVRALVAEPPIPYDELVALTSDEERRRAARFLHEIDARRHLIARGLVRASLGRVLDRDPVALTIRTTANGKPWVDGGPSFNIAHSGDVVLLAFASSGRLGVDVEAVRPLRDLLQLARTSFAPDEIEALLAVPEPARLRAFFRNWSRKEAMLKALGAGLSALSTISVSCADGVADALRRYEPAGDDPAPWSVRSVACHPSAEAAVAWDRPIARVTSLQL